MSLQHAAMRRTLEAKHLGPRFLRHVVHRWGDRPFEVTVKGVGPMTLRPRTSDSDVVAQVFAEMQYDLRRFGQFDDVRARVDDIMARGRRPLVVDLGANIGASSVWFARLFPQAKVIAVEPDPDNVAICRRNARGYDIEVVAAAIGSEAGFVDLVDSTEKWAVRTVRREEAAVPVTTMARLLAEHGEGCELLLVKVDIEGFEADLFAANTEWVAEAMVLIVEPHDWMLPGEHTSRSFQRVIGQYDFDLLIMGENLIYVRSDAQQASTPSPAPTP